jgi:MFS family permease
MSKKASVAAASGETPKYAWAVLFALYLASLTATLNMFKLPPIIPNVVGAFGIEYATAGDLMSVFSIMGFVLAIPAGFILKRFGIKLAVLFSIGTVLIGAVLGAVAASSGMMSFGMLYAGRFIEGIGMGLVMVASPFAISQWFPLNNRALPTGLWASCVGIGNILPLLVVPRMVEPLGLASIWWAGAIFAAVSFVLFAIIFRMPREDEMPAAPAPPSASGEAPPSLWKGMSNINYWLLGIGFGTYNLVVMALLTFLPTFLSSGHSDGRPAFYTAAAAGMITTLVMLASIITGPLGGYVSDKLGKRKAVALAVYAAMTLTLLIPLSTAGWQIPAFMILFGLFGGPIAPILLASVPEVAKSPMLIGIGMACTAVCQNLGMFLGPMMYIRIVNAYGGIAAVDGVEAMNAQGWATAGYWMIPICIIGMLAIWRTKVR